jgi:hypothetical protein
MRPIITENKSGLPIVTLVGEKRLHAVTPANLLAVQ